MFTRPCWINSLIDFGSLRQENELVILETIVNFFVEFFERLRPGSDLFHKVRRVRSVHSDNLWFLLTLCTFGSCGFWSSVCPSARWFIASSITSSLTPPPSLWKPSPPCEWAPPALAVVPVYIEMFLVCVCVVAIFQSECDLLWTSSLITFIYAVKSGWAPRCCTQELSRSSH